MPRIRFVSVALAIALIALFAIPSYLAPSASANTGFSVSGSAGYSTPIDLTLNLSPIQLNSSFWGTTISATPSMFPNTSSIVAATPARLVMWPGANAGDDYDYQTGSIWSDNNSAVRAGTTEADFATWCHSTGCRPILEVPGVIDDPAFAAQEVNYTENTLGLHPAYWEIGNEPGFWSHWNQSWGNWTQQVPGPTPMQYAEEVENYTRAMRQVDPTLRLIGLPAVGRTGPGEGAEVWINDIIQVDGPNLSALAVHIYPDLTSSLSTLPQYYSTLTRDNSQSIPTRIVKIRSEIASAAAATPGCSCAGIPVFFTELGSAITGRPDGAYAEEFPGALYIAAEITEAIDYNVTNVDAFATDLNTVNSWFDTSGQFRPEYTLYSTILPHLGPTAYAVNVSGLPDDVYAIATANASAGGTEDLMVVNTDTTSSVSFAPVLPGGLSNARTEIWTWDNGSTAAPVATFASALPSHYVLPPQSLVLFESRPGPAEPVQFSDSGLPSSLRWFLGVDGHMQTTTAGNFSLLLPPGTYALTPGAPIPVPKEAQRARWVPTPPATFEVGSSAVNVSVPLTLQYALNVTVSPAGTGSVGSAPAWFASGAPLTLTATPAPGYVFVRWQGGGAGNYSGAVASASFTPAGPIRETAVFAKGYGEEFIEQGLPNGAAWSVTVRNQTFTSTSSTLRVVERNGTYLYDIPLVSVYKPRPYTGAFVAGSAGPTVVKVSFVSPLVPVKFYEDDLPDGTDWSVVIDNHTSTAGNTSALTVYLTNGQYGYRIPALSSYVARPQGGSFSVTVDSPPVIQINFSLVGPGSQFPTYNLRFHEAGLPSGWQWTVTLTAGVAYPVYWSSTADNLTISEPNGTYSFVAAAVSGYVPSPGSGTVTVNGTGGQVIVIEYRTAAASTGVVSLPGLWMEVFRAVLVTVIIGVTGFGTFAALYWRGRRPPASPLPDWVREAAIQPPELHEGGHSGPG
ncbi:MAG: hypothetical protein WB778_05825 [Thermoplasmata archaeon]